MRARVNVFDIDAGIRKKKKRGAARLPVFFESDSALEGGFTYEKWKLADLFFFGFRARGRNHLCL